MGRTTEEITKEEEETIQTIVETTIEEIISVVSIIIIEVGLINEEATEEATTDIRIRKDGNNSNSLYSKITVLAL